MQLRTRCADFALDVMARGHAICVKIFGRLQQIFEFHTLIAANTGHGCRPSQVTFGKIADNRFAKFILIVQNIMRKIELFRHAARVVNVAASAACTLFSECCSMVIKLERNANNIIALRRQFGRNNRAINPA